MKFRVAEISKNWGEGSRDNKPIIAVQFEAVINHNYTQGYFLKEWKFTNNFHDHNLTETIIAVFELAQ